MIKAYKGGVPDGGKLFPEGSKTVKIEWLKKKNPESPYFVEVPAVLKSLAFIEKDSKRFPNAHGWAYAKFEYDAASKMFKPSVTGFECGYACHTKVASKDYIFTAHPTGKYYFARVVSCAMVGRQHPAIRLNLVMETGNRNRKHDPGKAGSMGTERRYCRASCLRCRLVRGRCFGIKRQSTFSSRSHFNLATQPPRRPAENELWAP